MKAVMPRVVETEHREGLADYEAVAHLAHAAAALRTAARGVLPRLEGRTVWLVNSTAQGGGVAEILPTSVRLLRDLGVRTEWMVIESDRPEFFQLTKRIHNLVHGIGNPDVDEDDRALYEAVNRSNAEAFIPMLERGDIVIVHDPQPLPLAGMLAGKVDVLPIWRCHIGLDHENVQTRAAWSFMRPYMGAYRHTVFSTPEYVPSFLAGKSSVIYPGIDPLTSKNREMHLHEVVRLLGNAALCQISGPLTSPPFEHQAMRLQSDGTFRPAVWPEDIGLLSRPIVTQVSRWDRLKGFAPLLGAFAELKRRVLRDGPSFTGFRRRRLEVSRLVLAGPEAEGVADDPEAVEVLEELKQLYLALKPSVQADIALITLPMAVRRENALMVNALQRASSVVVQNSLREGFGLTLTEAMWKRIPVLTSTTACGPRHQVRDDKEGRLIRNPEDINELADALADVLSDPVRGDRWGQQAQRRVHDRFLVLGQLEAWMETLATLL